MVAGTVALTIGGVNDLGAYGADAPGPDAAPLAQEAEVTFGIATRYGESYNGSPMGCPGSGVYISDDPSIVAVGYADARRWPCGTRLMVCSFLVSSGRELRWESDALVRDMWCLEGTRQDTCPGCGAGHVDLSEAGITWLCGYLCGRVDVLILEVRSSDDD